MGKTSKSDGSVVAVAPTKIARKDRYHVVTRPSVVSNKIDKSKKQRKSEQAVAILCKTADIVMSAFLMSVQQNLDEHETLKIQHIALTSRDKQDATHGLFNERLAGIFQPRQSSLADQDNYVYADVFDEDDDVVMTNNNDD